jgi:hypothetical protein
VSSLFLTTFSGNQLDLWDPQPDQIELDDIAVALSRLCRFNGQATRFYSVAQHAVLVQRLVVEAGRPDLALNALHHDSHEAFAGDLASPVKHRSKLDQRSDYGQLCKALDIAVGRRFCFTWLSLADEQVVKAADQRAILAEARVLLADGGAAVSDALAAAGVDVTALEPLPAIEPLAPDAACAAFVDTHASLVPD